MRYHQILEGEWQQPIQRGYRLRCCKCGLVHRMDFRITKTKRPAVEFRVFRVRRRTRRGR